MRGRLSEKLDAVERKLDDRIAYWDTVEANIERIRAGQPPIFD
jgi:hypothetical protein